MTAATTQPQIQRSWPATFMNIGIGVAFAAAAFAIFKYTNFGLALGSFGFVLAVFGVVFLSMAYGGSGQGVCPGCGGPLTGLSLGSNDGVACTSCHKYYEGKNGVLWATDEARLADSPLFASALPEKFILPVSCCVCGKAPTRGEKISMSTQAPTNSALAGATGLVRTSTASVEVPHCDEHKGGAALAGTSSATKIKFRSYPYLRDFCALNGTQVGG